MLDEARALDCVKAEITVEQGNETAFAVALSPGSTVSIEQWSRQIRSVWAKGAANTFELARVVCHARESLRYGAWARLWAEREEDFLEADGR